LLDRNRCSGNSASQQRLHVHGLFAQPMKPAGAGLRFRQQLLHIPAVKTSRYKGGWLDVRQTSVRPLHFVRLQPVDKVRRAIGKGAHLSRRDIQQVARLPRAVGHPLPKAILALDQRHRNLRLILRQQVKRRHGSAKVGANDGYIAK
jgi:hypothetical protein